MGEAQKEKGEQKHGRQCRAGERLINEAGVGSRAYPSEVPSVP